MITNSGRCRPQASRGSTDWRHAAVLSPPMLRMARRTFCLTHRPAMATSTEMTAALSIQAGLGDGTIQDDTHDASSVRRRQLHACQPPLRPMPDTAHHAFADSVPGLWHSIRCCCLHHPAAEYGALTLVVPMVLMTCTAHGVQFLPGDSDPFNFCKGTYMLCHVLEISVQRRSILARMDSAVATHENGVAFAL